MKKPTLALFPGQGSQHVGMGKTLCADFPIAREAFEEASDATSLNIRKLCFDGPESDLTLTENTQPTLLTASVAAFRVAQKELGFKPAAVAGHSLGEYSALVAAGALPLAAAARWVHQRGLAMQKAVPAGQGTMAAVMGLDEAQIGVLCARATEQAVSKRSSGVTVDSTGETVDYTVDAVVQPANYNSPGQIVIAGSTDAVAEAVAMIKAGGDFAGAKAIPLSVSAPFHCSLMKPARDRMAELFAQATSNEKARTLICPYVPNRTARITSEPGLVFDLLIEQVDHPVLWMQSMNTLLAEGFEHAVEFGPGKVLQGLMKRIGNSAGKTCAMVGVSDGTTLKALEAYL